jgi:hypothetical protein
VSIHDGYCGLDPESDPQSRQSPDETAEIVGVARLEKLSNARGLRDEGAEDW